jgi:hypothetical protein
MKSKHVGLSFVAALLAGTSAMAQTPGAAETLATEFCAAAMMFDEVAAETLMTPDLRQVIAAARVVSDAYAAANPGDKPPFGDGLALMAYQDAPESCIPEEVTETGAVLAYAPAVDPSAVWRDRIEFIADADGRLLISDIVYAPDYTRRFSTWLTDITIIE